MTEASWESLASTLETFTPPTDASQRIRLWEAARLFMTRVEDEYVTQHRIMGAPLQLIVPRLASDMDLFTILVNETPGSDKGFSVAELALRCKMEERSLARILRYLSAHHMISEVSPYRYRASLLTPTFAQTPFAAGMRFAHTCILPATSAVPTFRSASEVTTTVASQRSEDLTLSKVRPHSPFQLGHKTSLDAWNWIKALPALHNDFNLIMAETHKGEPKAFSILPMRNLVGLCTSPSKALFVDVGGGTGKWCQSFKENFPELLGRVINQDLRSAIDAGVVVEGVEHMVHDFFEAQPVHEAKIYFLRRILHNWSDERCIEILRRLRDAMGEGSLIIVDEIVLPESGTSWYLAYSDITMFAMFGAGLRSKQELEVLHNKAGLEVFQMFRYTELSMEAAIVARRMRPGSGY